jgi:GAF domain-containing protein
MLTGILAWATLISGVVVLAIALRVRGSAARGRMRLVALVLSLWSAVALAVLLGRPNTPTESNLVVPSGEATVFAISLCLGLLVTLHTGVRNRPIRRQEGMFRRTADSLWQAVVRATTTATSLDEMLFGVAAALRTATGARAAHVFKISHVRGRALRVGTLTEQAGSTLASVPRWAGDDGAERKELAWRAAVERDLVVSPAFRLGAAATVGVPLGADGTVYAAILLDNPRLDPHDPPARRTLLGIGALVGRAVADWTEATLGATYGRLCSNLRRTLPTLIQVDRLERGLPVITATLRGVFDFDYLSVAWLNKARYHEDRASVVMGDEAAAGEHIVESRRRWPIADSTTRRVMALRRALITPDLRMAPVDGSMDGEPWECRLGMCSRLVVAIVDGSEVIGALTVAHRRVARFGESEAHVLTVISDVLSLWLRGLAAARDADHLRAVETFVRQLWDDAVAWRDDAALIAAAKQLLDVSGLRLYRCDPEVITLEEVATAGRVGWGVVPSRVALGRLPWHRWALDSGRLLRIDQGDPESLMNENEAELTLAAGVKTGCVVPITAGGRRLGVLDVIEMRDPDRSSLDRIDQFLLAALANALAKRWTGRPGTGGDRGDDGSLREFTTSDQPVLEAALKNLNREIVNPLTSIIGSAELIRHKQPDLNADAIKYLKMIETSAARVYESTSGFLVRMGRGDVVPDRHRRIAETEWVSGLTGDSGIRRTSGLTRPASLLESQAAAPARESSLSAWADRGAISEWRKLAPVTR